MTTKKNKLNRKEKIMILIILKVTFKKNNEEISTSFNKIEIKKIKEEDSIINKNNFIFRNYEEIENYIPICTKYKLYPPIE